jgi:plastocyanin
MRRATMTAVTMLALAAAIPALGAGSGRVSRTHTVVLKEIRFHPGTLTIHRGESVKWVWRDSVEHNVTFHSFHSRTQERGSYTVRFNRAGTYNYRCTIHVSEGMRGKIIVR